MKWPPAATLARSPVLTCKALLRFHVRIGEKEHNRTPFFFWCRKASVVADPLLDFCKEAVASAPDLPPLGADNDPAPPGKRSRSNKEGVDVAGSPQKQSRSRGGGRGRGRGKAAGVPTNEIEVGVDDTTAAIFTAGGLADASFLEAAPGKEAEEEDYDA